MKILVIVKQVVAETAAIELQNNAIDLEKTPQQTSSLDLIAIEEAIGLQEKGYASELTACTIGPETADKSLRTALAMGIGKAVHFLTEETLDNLRYAQIMHDYIGAEGFDLVITGREDSDGGSGILLSMIAGLMDCSQADFVTELDVTGHKNGTVTVCCYGTEGQTELSLSLPALIGVDTGLNEPRFVKFPQLLKARKQAVDRRKVDDALYQGARGNTVIEMKTVQHNRLKQNLGTVEELARILKEKQ